VLPAKHVTAIVKPRAPLPPLASLRPEAAVKPVPVTVTQAPVLAEQRPAVAVAIAVKTLPASERRILRRRLMRACPGTASVEAASAGRVLRQHGGFDWESSLCFARVLQRLGAVEDAQRAFDEFLAEFPDNRFVPEIKDVLATLNTEQGGLR
jgi:hypothetical protein